MRWQGISFALCGGRALEHLHRRVHVRNDRVRTEFNDGQMCLVECDAVCRDHSTRSKHERRRHRDVARQQRIFDESSERHAKFGTLVHESRQWLLEWNGNAVDVLSTPNGRFRTGGSSVDDDLLDHAPDVRSTATVPAKQPRIPAALNLSFAAGSFRLSTSDKSQLQALARKLRPGQE